MTWVPPSRGGYGPPEGYHPPPGVPVNAGGPPPARVSERQARAERALRALPPPPRPPAGMGAVPAFAPPVPRRNRTVLIVSLVLGATLLLCCGGGVSGVGGLVYFTYSRQQDDAMTSVETYLGDLRAGRYEQAYGRLCYQARSVRSADEFAARQRAAGQVTGFRIDEEIQVGQDSDWLLTAQVTRAGNAPRTETFPVTFDDDTNTATVCPG